MKRREEGKEKEGRRKGEGGKKERRKGEKKERRKAEKEVSSLCCYC